MNTRIAISAIVMLLAPLAIEGQTVPSNVLTRVFQLRYNGTLATAFTLDIDGRQYLVTARHVVKGMPTESSIELRRESDWQKVSVKLVEVKPQEVDIAVLAPASPISISLPLEAGMRGLYVSQEVAFVGFPYGMLPEIAGINLGYPIAFVKHGVCAAFDFHKEQYSAVWVDGHNNPGFSGAPVVFHDSKTKRMTVAAVVTGFRHAEEPVRQNGKETGATVRVNTGLLLAHGIDPALKAIRDNPIGAPIPKAFP